MSLYNGSKHVDQTEASWQKYEITPFGALSVKRNGDIKEFVALQTDNPIHSDFMPLEIGNEDRETIQASDVILETPQERTALIEQEAYEKGFAQGEKDGFELGEKKALTFIDNIEKLFLEITHLNEAILKRYEREIVEVIFSIAETIVHRQIQMDGDVIRTAILSALKLAVERSEIKLRVTPEDYDYIDKLRPELFASFRELKSVVVTSDPSITRGGCIMETPKGDIDASIETRLEKVRQCLVEAFHEDSNE